MENGILWAVFGVVVLVMLALDLGVFHKKAHVVSVREALIWTGIWIVIGLAFAMAIRIWVDPAYLADPARSAEHRPSLEYLTCYLTEYALSVDNIFVFLVIFTYFAIPEESQHRVLFWGILGAMVMRALFLWVGIGAIERFHWMIWVLGGLLVVTGIKLFFQKEDAELDPSRNIVLRLAKKFLPVTDKFHGSKFFVRIGDKNVATPLFLALLVVETTDVLFALDSVPAALGISQNLFVVYTSNIFAILGLRSLFFAVGGLLKYLHYLKFGLSLILVFVGVKMLLPEQYKISITVALSVVGGVLLLAVIASVVRARLVGERASS
ncbi:MAG: TerC family protein [Planctomycetota bacterium]|nr:TerC family protein [Planctomycetota bacterium]